MPEPTVTPDPKQDKPAAPPVTVDMSALGESISKGLAKELAALREPRPQEQPAAPPPAAPPPIPEPSYDEIMEAIESGDRKKAERLMSQRERAREQRMDRELIEPLRQQGTYAINQMAEQLGQQYLARLPKKFHPAVKKYIDEARGRGVMINAEHWQRATNMVYGENAEEIENEMVEARLRQAREKPEGLESTQGGNDQGGEKEAETLRDEFSGTFNEQFKLKARAKGGLTEEEEVRRLNQGVKAGRALDDKGRPKRDYSVKDYLKERREMQRYAEENPSLGLDE